MIPLFNNRVGYYKNGIWWFTKLFNRVIGESRYDYLRLERRIAIAKFYYIRQQILHQIFLDFPEVAHTIGIYPKADSSHGYPHLKTYETFRDFQDNTINSDGWFAMMVVVICLSFTAWTLYCYNFPYYWTGNRPIKNGGDIRRRMIDALSSAVVEESYGNRILEEMLTPHMFHAAREKLIQGYRNPDDIRTVHMTSIDRKHVMKEHFMKMEGEKESMLY